MVIVVLVATIGPYIASVCTESWRPKPSRIQQMRSMMYMCSWFTTSTACQSFAQISIDCATIDRPPCTKDTRFNKIAIQGTPQMAVDKEANSLSRVYS